MSRLQFTSRIMSKDILLHGFFHASCIYYLSFNHKGDQESNASQALLKDILMEDSRGRQRAVHGGQSCSVCREPSHLVLIYENKGSIHFVK